MLDLGRCYDGVMSRESTGGGGGSNAGAPTLTTPTLTPTTLRNIEQMFADRDPHEPPPHHENAAGFVPPIIRLLSARAEMCVVLLINLFPVPARDLPSSASARWSRLPPR